MTAADRRLAALLAAFAPSRTRELAARLSAASAPELAAHAARLAAAARRERLAALAAAFAPDRPMEGSAVHDRAAAGAEERPRLAAVLRGLGRGPHPRGLAPALARLLRDRVGSPRALEVGRR